MSGRHRKRFLILHARPTSNRLLRRLCSKGDRKQFQLLHISWSNKNHRLKKKQTRKWHYIATLSSVFTTFSRSVKPVPIFKTIIFFSIIFCIQELKSNWEFQGKIKMKTTYLPKFGSLRRTQSKFLMSSLSRPRVTGPRAKQAKIRLMRANWWWDIWSVMLWWLHQIPKFDLYCNGQNRSQF